MSKLFVASWVVLLVLAALLTFASANAMSVPLRRAPDQLTPAYSVAQLASADPEAADAVRGRRVTAATWALGYALLMAFLVLVPYRRGERWAWWALLVSLGGSQLLSLLRVPMLGTTLGAAAAGIPLAVLALGLLLGAPRMFGRRAGE